MITRDNHGNISSEINTSFTSDGKVITTNTMYYNGKPVAQNISERDSRGHVETTNVVGNKIRP